jgi:hypothetical protein
MSEQEECNTIDHLAAGNDSIPLIMKNKHLARRPLSFRRTTGNLVARHWGAKGGNGHEQALLWGGAMEKTMLYSSDASTRMAPNSPAASGMLE